MQYIFNQNEAKEKINSSGKNESGTKKAYQFCCLFCQCGAHCDALVALTQPGGN